MNETLKRLFEIKTRNLPTKKSEIAKLSKK